MAQERARMTYGVGMLVNEGLAMIADTRTNAGVDNISTYKKLFIIEKPGERVIAIVTAGNLSVTQTALARLKDGIRLPDSIGRETLMNVPTLVRAVQLVGHAIKTVRHDFEMGLQARPWDMSATILLGGQVADGELGLYLIYPEGNAIACGPDTPYLQVGELKYGKPILDRALRADTPLVEAVKLGLISFDSTMRSNLGVGLPLDMVVIRPGALHSVQRRIEADDTYFRELGLKWSDAIYAAHRAMPAPPWDDI
jgi:putative proteasome-type protease